MVPIIDTWTLVLIVGLIGLVIGSFLNVIIYRLPLMMQQQWRKQCLNYLELPAEEKRPASFNLFWPRSHCQSCKVRIPFWRNIPLLSFLLQAGRCAKCRAKISWRYPIVELLTAIISASIVYQFGPTDQMLAVLLLTCGLIVLIFIDVNHQLLPDDIILSLLWLGLLCNAFGWFTTPVDAIFGAVIGYGALWIFAHLFQWIRGKEGMGYGDFKLFALFGAWLGWQALLPIILIASFLGSIGGIIFLVFKRLHRDTPLPFGPYLAVAGWIMLFWGQEITRWYFSLFNN